MKAPFLCLSVLALAGCQTTLSTSTEGDAAPPPYPPGYEPAGRTIPDRVEQNLPAGISPEQVLIADNGCYFYHVGALTSPITAEDGRTKLCIQREEPATVPVDLSGVSLGAPPKS